MLFLCFSVTGEFIYSFFVTFIQPRSQGLSSNRPLRRARRDPGLVWSRATLTIENIREGSSVVKQFVALSFVTRPRGLLDERPWERG